MKQSYGFVETGGLGVRRLPSWSQAAVALILLAIAIAKAVALSGQQVEAALFPVPVLWMVTVLEFALGVAVVCCRGDWVLFVTSGFGVVLLASLGAMLLSGHDSSSCGCFGTLKLDAVSHALVAACIAGLPALELLKPERRQVARAREW
jgi:hypothetical protein